MVLNYNSKGLCIRRKEITSPDMKGPEPHLQVVSASVENSRQQRKTEDKYRGSSLEFSRFHVTTKQRKKPSFQTSWESLNRHDPNHSRSLPSDSVFFDITSKLLTQGKTKLRNSNVHLYT